MEEKTKKIKYNLNMPWLTLDPWQKEYIKAEGNTFLLCGRQSGKTTAASIKFGERAAKKPHSTILMIAFTEKQAYNLFFKTLMYLEATHPYMIVKKGKDKPTQHRINLKNGSKILCYAAGLTGMGLVGYTITDLVVDEAASMNRQIFTLLTPTLSVTGGSINLLSTPRGKEGYYYECSQRKDFNKFYVSAEDCPRHSKDFLEAEKSRMSELEYAQEYMAQFLDDLKRLYPDELLNECCVGKRGDFKPGRYYFGADIAGLGEDVTTYEIINKISNDKYIQVENIVERKTLTNKISDKIIQLNKTYKFRKIGIDDGGVGFGVWCELINESTTKKRTIALNNSKRSTDKDDTSSTKLMKEVMYFNLKALMEHKRITLLNDSELIDSLKSIQWEYVIKEGQKTRLRIFGRNSHIVEGIIRACWLASQDKVLNIWAA